MTDLSFYVPHISRESLDAEATAFLEAGLVDRILLLAEHRDAELGDQHVAALVEDGE